MLYQLKNTRIAPILVMIGLLLSVNADVARAVDGHATGIVIAPRVQATAAMASKNHRQIIVVMFIAVANAAAIHDHRIVQDRLAIYILSLLQFLKKPGEGSHVIAVDLRNFLSIFLFLELMGEIMVALWHANLREGAVASIMGQ